MDQPTFTRAEINAVLHQDFLAFVHRCFQQLEPGQTFAPEWFLEAIAYELGRIYRGENRRLIINMPPRSLKSIMASVAFPAFVLGRDPRRRIICVSYSSDLATKHAADCRAVVASRWYQAVFPGTRIGGKDTQSEFTTTQRGGRQATSIGGTLTGRGGDLIIIDDPLKGQDAMSEAKRAEVIQSYSNTLISRLDDKRTGSIIVVMQRVHMDDLTGYLLQGGGEDWTVLSLPAIAMAEQDIPLLHGRVHHRQIGDVLSSREPPEILNELKRDMGGDAFEAQYQQQPVPPGGMIVKRDWVQRYKDLPTDRRGFMVVQSWDTAAKGGPANDYSVCTTWLKDLTGAQHFLVHVWRDRVDYPGLKKKVVELAQTFDAKKVLIEDSTTAMALIQELRPTVRGLTAIKPENDKKSRMAVAAAQFEAKQVYFPLTAPWLKDLETELFSFPGGRHDDQVDSISQALLHRNKTMETWARLAAQIG